jgi:hypothetical protein
MKVAHQEPAIAGQLPLSPMRVLAVRIEHALHVAIQCATRDFLAAGCGNFARPANWSYA